MNWLDEVMRIKPVEDSYRRISGGKVEEYIQNKDRRV